MLEWETKFSSFLTECQYIYLESNHRKKKKSVIVNTKVNSERNSQN